MQVIDHRVVALILLLSVSMLAMIFEIIPVLLAAVLSALLWNFLFIPPLYKFSIGTPEDVLLFLMYFVIALLNAVLTARIRRAELRSKEKEGRMNTIQLYNTLLNSLSHELRTPIATILGSVDALKESTDKLSEIHKSELLSEISLASVRLNRQVDNLLNISRIESGFIKAKSDWCDMSELVHSVAKNQQDESPGHIFKVSQNENIPMFKVDRGLMEQVLKNIFHNAALYTPVGSEIRISLKHADNNLELVIDDNGPGFPEEEIGSVFDKFYRLPNSAAGGTGLGLSIVKGFVEAQNGTIKLTNVPGGGARFIISIPSETSFIDDLQQHEQA